MRLLRKCPTVLLALAMLSGCADAPRLPTSVDAGAVEADRAVSMTTVAGALDLRRPRIELTSALDLRLRLPLALVTPDVARNIGPGSAILITIPDEGRFGCTANFVWEAKGRRYLGAAGHCFLPEDRTATHGVGADYDASGVVVEVCVDGCEGNFRTSQITGTWVTLGKVAYARQANAEGSGVGHDFGVVEIPRQFESLVRRSLPVWGGPTGVQTLNLGDYACHYGNGLGVGEVFLTKARIGVGGSSDAESWAGDFAAAFGDSGSALVGCVNDGIGSFRGTGAIGVLTHLGVRASASGEHGFVLGTTVARAIEMAAEAKLKLTLLLE